MPLVRCTGCQQRPQSLFTSVYWAWNNADGQRRAYKGRLCDSCFLAKVAPLDIDQSIVESLTCPQCGIATEADFDAIYATAYVRGGGPLRVEAPFCGPCAARYRVWVTEGATLLEDRWGATGGAPTDDEPVPAWQRLGLRPRA